MYNSIQIFASDYRKNIDWKLPYIRLGNYQSDAAIQINFDKKMQLQYTDISQIFWVYEHYIELGNPDVVGFCHYRRFFSQQHDINALPMYVLNDSNPKFIADALTPIQQLELLKTFDLDGIIPYPVLEEFCIKDKLTKKENNKQFQSIAEYFYLQLESQNTGITLDQINFAIKTLYYYTPENLKESMLKAFTKLPVHFCSIFTLKKELFFVWYKLIYQTLNVVETYCTFDKLKKMNCRILGYIGERLSSCILYAFKENGAKLMNMPLIVLDANKNIKQRTQTLEEALKEIDNV